MEQVGLLKTTVQSQEGLNFLFTKIMQLCDSIQTKIVTLPESFQSGTQQNSCPSTLDCSSITAGNPALALQLLPGNFSSAYFEKVLPTLSIPFQHGYNAILALL